MMDEMIMQSQKESGFTVKQYCVLGMALLVTLSVSACGSDSESSGVTPGGNQQNTPQAQCLGVTYVPFDATAYATQVAHVQAHADMATKMKQAAALLSTDAAGAMALVNEAKALYLNTPGFQQAVQSTLDEHPAVPLSVGAEIDSAVMSGFTLALGARSAFDIDFGRQIINKGLYDFFFLGMHHGFSAGTRAGWDRGFGYFGASLDQATKSGLANVAMGRDTVNGTSLEPQLFNGIKDGSCELAKALRTAGSDHVNVRDVPALHSVVTDIDQKLQAVLAYYAVHEAIEIANKQNVLAQGGSLSDANKASLWIALVEMQLCYRPLMRVLLQRGGDVAVQAQQFMDEMAELTEDGLDVDVNNTAWVPTLNVTGFKAFIEAQYAIQVKG